MGARTIERPEAETPWSPRRVSEYLGIPVKTLALWRFEGRELHQYYKLGRAVRYDPAVVRAYKASALRQSTAEEGREC